MSSHIKGFQKLKRGKKSVNEVLIHPVVTRGTAPEHYAALMLQFIFGIAF